MPASMVERLFFDPDRFHVSRLSGPSVLVLLGETWVPHGYPVDTTLSVAYRQGYLDGRVGQRVLRWMDLERERGIGISCVLSSQFARLCRSWPRERLLLLPAAVLPWSSCGLPMKRESSSPLFVCRCSTVEHSQWIRDAVMAVGFEKDPVFLICPPAYVEGRNPCCLIKSGEKPGMVNPFRVPELVYSASLILHLPLESMEDHDLEGISLLSTGIPCVSSPSGWWSELPEGTFLPFYGAEGDSDALAKLLRSFRTYPHLGETLSERAKFYSLTSIDRWAKELIAFMERLEKLAN